MKAGVPVSYWVALSNIPFESSTAIDSSNNEKLQLTSKSGTMKTKIRWIDKLPIFNTFILFFKIKK